jgi:hemolysin III
MLGVIWAVAIGGIVLKALWINAPRWLSSSLYIIMGWLVIFAIYPLFKILPREGFIWLVAGGVIYTIGGVIYGTKWPKIKADWFGFHEIFHLLVMGGSICHFILIYSYV